LAFSAYKIEGLEGKARSTDVALTSDQATIKGVQRGGQAMSASDPLPPRPGVSPPVPATALLVDLRNFTPNLNAAPADEQGISDFCRFLSEFYALCLEASLLALPPALRGQRHLYVNSTGDGVLILCLHSFHVRQAFLAGLMLHLSLQDTCDEYNGRAEPVGCPKVSFGIGIESGEVCGVRAGPEKADWPPRVETYIGSCINVAARAEALTKGYYRAQTIVAEQAHELLCRGLLGQSYRDLVRAALEGGEEGQATNNTMTDLDRRLCLGFLHYHHLKGVDGPLPLFRITDYSAHPRNDHFRTLLGQLTDGDRHAAEVADFLQRRAPGSQAGPRRWKEVIDPVWTRSTGAADPARTGPSWGSRG
jgi:class 3 adenylate cyclase